MEQVTVTMSKSYYDSLFGVSGGDSDSSILIGTYNHTYKSSTNTTPPSSFLPRIVSDNTMENPFGSNLSNARTVDITINNKNKTLTIKGGWEHYALGRMPYDVIFDMGVDEKGKFNGTLTMRNTATFSGGAVFESYVLTKIG